MSVFENVLLHVMLHNSDSSDQGDTKRPQSCGDSITCPQSSIKYHNGTGRFFPLFISFVFSNIQAESAFTLCLRFLSSLHVLLHTADSPFSNTCTHSAYCDSLRISRIGLRMDSRGTCTTDQSVNWMCQRGSPGIRPNIASEYCHRARAQRRIDFTSIEVVSGAAFFVFPERG